MHFNICIVRPDEYIHSDAFLELAEVLMYGLQDLGHSALVCENALNMEGGRNIIIGCHLISPATNKWIPEDSIFLNTEQIFADKVFWHSEIYQWAKDFQTWDYSERNILKLQTICSKPPKFFKIGYHKNLERIPTDRIKDIDVLFYGSTNDRRSKILNELAKENLVVKQVFGVYGKERDDLISRSKIVLNLHYYNSKIFEIVRVFYLLINRKAVVSEISPGTHIPIEYQNGVCGSNYDNLVQTCVQLARDPDMLAEYEQRGYECIKKLPQHELIKDILF